MESAAISVPHIVIARRATPDVAISTWQSTPPLAIVIARSEATWQSTPPLPPVPVLPPLGGDKNGNAIGTATGDLHELPTAPRDTVSAPSAAYRRGAALRRRDKDGGRGTLRRRSRRGRWRNRAKAPPRANPLRLKRGTRDVASVVASGSLAQSRQGSPSCEPPPLEIRDLAPHKGSWRKAPEGVSTRNCSTAAKLQICIRRVEPRSECSPLPRSLAGDAARERLHSAPLHALSYARGYPPTRYGQIGTAAGRRVAAGVSPRCAKAPPPPFIAHPSACGLRSRCRSPTPTPPRLPPRPLCGMAALRSPLWSPACRWLVSLSVRLVLGALRPVGLGGGQMPRHPCRPSLPAPVRRLAPPLRRWGSCAGPPSLGVRGRPRVGRAGAAASGLCPFGRLCRAGGGSGGKPP